MNIQINFLWKINLNDESVSIEPLLFELLVAIESLGSLQQAALQCKTSYRHAWGLMEKWQNLLGSPLLSKQRGRGAQLTPLGEKLVQAHQQLHARYAPQLANHATDLTHELTQLRQHDNNQLKFFTSHGLAVSALRDNLNRLQELPVELHFHGSLQSLRALHANECDIAGFHLPEGEVGQQLAIAYQSYLNPHQHRLIYLVRRLQGLMVAKGNPLSIHSLSDLVSSGCRFINRQNQSATRVLLDKLLEHHQIDSNQITGFDQVEYTHMAVAAMVASNAFDCGFGLAAAARKFGLDFIPLQWEHYCLAVNSEKYFEPNMQTLLECLKSPAYLEELAGLEGYEMDRCGEAVDFESIFFKK
ncbi:substrate-binding domain-containing protein [Methylophaga pinxianii]|uniref:helix-turn-helix transcriptional regulator n=1 Tax=Methylophaga pinxianii TaxID=2881052 RepID=UPI001CF53B7C|nr:substrate-binding domain-containing protein [Methylophaga pinxianii]MCB2427261.1 helix-turn-helix transcriptional regulator [Methylophaga pinxianii]UPH46471.1 helix-turn-helix transcriptional regulator [Methylophaga pinxianii]